MLDGVRRYILSLFDPVSRTGFAVVLPSKTTHATAQALAAPLGAPAADERPSCSSKTTLSAKGTGPAHILAQYIVEHYNWPLEKPGFWPPWKPHREASLKRFV